MSQVERVLGIGNHLGECPVWSVDEHALYWVNIEQGRIYRYIPATGQVQDFDVGVPIGCLGLRASGGLITGTRDGLAFWNPHTRSLEAIASPEAGKPDARFNDGKVDRQGRFWAGTMAPGATSSLYRLDADLSVHTMETGVGVSNGIGWSPDNRTMYYTDSPRRVIYAYDFDAATGAIENRRPFVLLADDEPGAPDGLAVDSQGFVWSVRWDGWRVSRYDPAGKLEREFKLPVQRPTSCAFGGEQLDELYITSAWTGLSDKRSEQPFAGDLFRLRTDVKGLAEPKFAG